MTSDPRGVGISQSGNEAKQSTANAPLCLRALLKPTQRQDYTKGY